MPLFIAPVADASHNPTSRRHLSSIRREKRKRSLSPSSDEDENSILPEPSATAAASTNPLSLRPDEILQYRLAGLELDEELPNTGAGGVPDFPHRSLPPRQADRIQARKAKKKEKEQIVSESEADGDKARGQKGSLLRSQHLNVLTAILHRCLQTGDIPRATRAWSLLIRMEVGGHPIDLRTSGYWGIGAELLARSLDDTSGAVRVEEHESISESQWRTGTSEGLQKAINYYQVLISTFPHRRQHPDAVTALDFWPAMLGCKIYAIQLEHLARMKNITQAENNNVDEEDEDFLNSGDEDEPSREFSDQGFSDHIVEDKRLRRRRKKAEKRWHEKDAVRRATLKAAEKLAATLNDLMLSKEYYSYALRRFRGMLALYVGDLIVPARPISHEDSEAQFEWHDDVDVTERRIIYRQRIVAHEAGLDKQKKEHALAKEMFDSIKEEGGYVGGNIDFLYPEETEHTLLDEAW